MSKKISKGTWVWVESGYTPKFKGRVKQVEWDFDHWIYLIKNDWYTQSEVTRVE